MHFDATFRNIKLKFETVACICQEQLYKKKNYVKIASDLC